MTYNSAGTIDLCLDALLAQRGVTFSLYVIDNASTDDTVARVRAKGVAITVNSSNVGYAVAHNQAIDQTTSDYVLTLNPDVRLDPGFLQALTEALDHDPSLGSACGCLFRVEALEDQATHIDSLGTYMRRNRRQGLIGDGLPITAQPDVITSIFGPDGAAAFYRRTMLEDIRVLDEIFDADFFMHKEDIDVCWRAQLCGWGSACVPGATARHVRGFRPGQRARVSAVIRFYGVRNRYLLMLKNEQRTHFLRDLPAIAIYDLGILAYLLVRERESLRALSSAWALRSRMIAKRRINQSGRRTAPNRLRHWFCG